MSFTGITTDKELKGVVLGGTSAARKLAKKKARRARISAENTGHFFQRLDDPRVS